MDFAKTMIRDLGPQDGRAYLLRNVPLWRATYGDIVADKVCKGIKVMLREAV